MIFFQPVSWVLLGRPKVVSPAPKSLPDGKDRPLPTGRHRSLFLDENPGLGVKTPLKRETNNLVKRAHGEQKHQKPICRTMVWVICAANHSPTAREPVSPKGVSRFSQDFFRLQKSVILKILRRSFEQVSPGRERIYFRQMFTVDQKNWCPNVQIGFRLSWSGETYIVTCQETL